MKKTINTAAAAAAAFLAAGSAHAAEISTNTAIMQAMDKITGQVSLIEIPVNQEVAFGSLSIVVRECKTRTPEETPENFAFVDVVDKNTAVGDVNIFKGWMLSSSPALNPVAHPVYDVWLLKCSNKDVDPKNLMSKEQLEERDTVTMSRDATEKTLNGQELPKNPENDPFPQAVDGEPINLIPDDLAENNQNNTAAPQAEEKPASVEEQATEPAIETEEGAPQALIDFSTQAPVAAPSELQVQEADFETIDIGSQPETTATEQSLPEEANVVTNEQTPNAEAPAPQVKAPQPQPVSDQTETAVEKDAEEQKNDVISADKQAENNEDIINKLEQELSAQLIGE